MTRPRRGLSVYPNAPVAELVERARVAESAGYDHLWFGDSQNIWRELYVTLGAVAVSTERIVLGTGVSNLVTRHRATVASAWATLHELTGGGTAAGFGVGDSALRIIGEEPMRVDGLRRGLAELRALWGCGSVAAPGAPEPYRLDHLGAPLDVPVFVAASGPRLLELAGSTADGVILLVGTDPATVREAIASIHRAARDAGRAPEEVTVVLWAPVAIDGDAEAAHDRVRAHVARTVLRPIGADLDEEERRAVASIRDAYDYYDHMVPGSAHAELVTPSLVRRFALAGTPEDCARRLDALGEAGVDEVAMVPFSGGDAAADRLLIERFAAL